MTTSVGGLGRAYRRMARYGEIAAVLVKHGLGDLVHTARLDRTVGEALRGRAARAHHTASRPERVRRALEELGPAFVKAGQYLSTRADLLPPEYLAQLACLQDDVPPFPAEQARAEIERELGAPVHKLFAAFDGRPLASASVAQVHAARLRGGARVVVKVLRPGVRQRVMTDLSIIRSMAELLERRDPAWAFHKPTRIVDEIARSADRELDLSIEASHLERFARDFAGDRTARAPRVVRELSSPRVLTMERLFGIKADDVAGLRAAGLDPRLVARRLATHYLKMIYVHGFFHGDPHPGNLLVLRDGAIGYLDFGMMGRLDRRLREGLAGVVHAIAERDERSLAVGLLALSESDEPPDQRRFQDDVAELMDQYAYRPLREWRIGRMLEQTLRETAAHHVRVPEDLFLCVKALSELESLTMTLDPAFDAVAVARPFIAGVMRRRAAPARVKEALLESAREAARALASAPSDLGEIVKKLRGGRLVIEFEHKGLEPALTALDRDSNRLSVAVLLAALLIASSLIVHARLPPFWRGVPVLGLAGYLLSGFLALWLLAAIARHERL